MSTPLEQLGQRVATCRQQAGLDVATLSQRARVPEAQLREFERGNGGLALAALSRLARVLGVPTSTFLHTDAPAARAYKLSSVLQQANSTFIHRVRLENYKSIAACDVVLGPLTFLVGRNGAGKSNFLNPERIRDLQVPGMGDMLARDGHNLSSVLGQLESRAPGLKQRLEEYLSQVVPGLQSVRTERLGPKETLEFTQETRGSSARHFLAASMSDGTLRALGVLVALFQPMVDPQRWVPLVAIEEPELTLHPSAAAVLWEALQECSQQRQVLITSHSPDLLDQKSLTEDEVLAVVAEHGETRIGRLDEAGCSALRERIYTVGELLRGNQLRPGEISLEPDKAESEGLHQEAREIVESEVAVPATVAFDERLDIVSRV
jgi:transcriptional regulator with XRE-family HTH domain